MIHHLEQKTHASLFPILQSYHGVGINRVHQIEGSEIGVANILVCVDVL